jgi:hypothetical protein
MREDSKARYDAADSSGILQLSVLSLMKVDEDEIDGDEQDEQEKDNGRISAGKCLLWNNGN